jgi:hypothetical protein
LDIYSNEGRYKVKELRIEVLSEEEALEFCEVNGYKFIECIWENGVVGERLMLLAIDPKAPAELSEEELREIDKQLYENEKNTVIFAVTSSGKMYVADNQKCSFGTTFKIGEAKRFTEAEAKKKAHFMTIKGSYCWVAWKIKEM